MTRPVWAGSEKDFGVCPHCWHINGAFARVCLACRADMTLTMQESGGQRWSAPAQSPMPTPGQSRLTRTQRGVLLGFVVLFALSQVLAALAPLAQSGATPEAGSSR